MSPCRYVAWFVATFCALATITALMNFIVDPYIVFGSSRIHGFNQVKTQINDYVRVAKAFEPFRQDTDILLAGNSRIEMGLDPDHACFKKIGLKAYNLGIPGAGVGQQLNFVLNVVYAQRVQRIFLSVDFVDFLVDEGSEPPAHDSVITTGNLPRRFDGLENPTYNWAVAQTRFQALLSLDAVVNSIQTVLLQGMHQPNRLENGFNPAQDFARATSLEGPGVLFEQKMASLRERFTFPKTIYYSDGSLARDFDLFSRFLAIAANERVEVVILTSPFHEWFWDFLREQELLEEHANWLAEIVKRVRMAPGKVTMWNFSDDSEFIHEPVPPPGVKASPLEWFWEPSHYRKTLGEKMLNSMLAPECGSKVSFGRQLLVKS